MSKLEEEVRVVRAHDYALAFEVPTAEQLKRMRRIHRDMSKAQRRKREQLTVYVGRVVIGDMALDDVPEEHRKAVAKAIEQRTKGTPVPET